MSLVIQFVRLVQRDYFLTQSSRILDMACGNGVDCAGGDSSDEIVRINAFSRFAFFVSIPMVLFFLLLNLVEGDIKEVLLSAVGICLLLVGIQQVQANSAPREIFRILYGGVSLILLIGACLQAGEGTIIFWLFSVPPLYFTMFGTREGLIWAVTMTLIMAIILFVPGLYLTDWYSPEVGIRFLITFSFVLFLSYGTEASRSYFGDRFQSEHKILLERKENLESALAELKILGGLLPICAKCKKIHNDNNAWQDIVEYVRDHSEADFSHGICPDCASKLYPDQVPGSD